MVDDNRYDFDFVVFDEDGSDDDECTVKVKIIEPESSEEEEEEADDEIDEEAGDDEDEDDEEEVSFENDDDEKNNEHQPVKAAEAEGHCEHYAPLETCWVDVGGRRRSR